MRRPFFVFPPPAVLASFVVLSIAPGPAHAATPATRSFAGAWLGEVVAPNALATIGFAFTPTEQGLLASFYMPEMAVYNVNLGPAQIDGGVFTFKPLDLTLVQKDDQLTGTFGIARLPVSLRRARAFAKPPPPTVFPAAPAPLWTRPLGAAVWASPVARDGTIYVGSVDGKFHAVAAADGRERWTWTGPHPLYGDALATDDSLYFVDDAAELVRLDRTDGSLKWRVPLHAASAPRPKNETLTHRTASPIIDAKGVLFVGSADRGIYAIRSWSGKILWRQSAPAPLYAPLALRDNDLVAGCYDGTVLVLSRRSGRESVRTRLGGPIVSAPVMAGDLMIVGSRDDLLYGVKLATGRVVWRDSYWFSWVESTPRLVDGTLYIGASDFRRVSALEPATGKTRWATDVLGLTWGSPVVTAATVFAGTAGQTLRRTVIHHSGGIVALDRKTGAVQWRYAAPAPANAEWTGYIGSLALAGSRIVGAGVDGTLVAFPSGEPEIAANAGAPGRK
jgi:outer membrane protein assembly factor BamB